MNLGPLTFFGQLFKTAKSRLFAGTLTFMAIYQFGCDQLGWPTLPKAWQLTGAKLPWWGWLLLLQGSLTIALFEYVRRAQLTSKDTAPESEPAPAAAPVAAPPALLPDMHYPELLKRAIHATVTDDEIQKDVRSAHDKVAKAIMDSVSLRNLAVWARSGGKPIEKIPIRIWNKGELSLMKGIFRSDYNVEYSDLMFARVEIDEVWPQLKK